MMPRSLWLRDTAAIAFKPPFNDSTAFSNSAICVAASPLLLAMAALRRASIEFRYSKANSKRRAKYSV